MSAESVTATTREQTPPPPTWLHKIAVGFKDNVAKYGTIILLITTIVAVIINPIFFLIGTLAGSALYLISRYIPMQKGAPGKNNTRHLIDVEQWLCGLDKEKASSPSQIRTYVSAAFIVASIVIKTWLCSGVVGFYFGNILTKNICTLFPKPQRAIAQTTTPELDADVDTEEKTADAPSTSTEQEKKFPIAHQVKKEAIELGLAIKRLFMKLHRKVHKLNDKATTTTAIEE